MYLETAEKTPGIVPARKPRIALMGEFSAGKSTLANLLLGQNISPVRVTATQMPPVWYAKGLPGATIMLRNGREMPISLEDLTSVAPRETLAVRVFMQSEVLDFCDLIDMPGTSDPNMAQDMWQDILSEAEGVVWCTPATQAWRQSEAAIWEMMPPDLWSRSLLLVTRMDKLLTERDRLRVIARVEREAGEYFKCVLPISLTEALSARDDDEVLESSGTGAFIDALIGLVEEMGFRPREAAESEADDPGFDDAPIEFGGDPENDEDFFAEDPTPELADTQDDVRNIFD